MSDFSDRDGGVSAAVRERWQAEGDKHARSGDYAWMAERVDARRVLEIGCGSGFGSAALAARGCALMVLEPDGDCISEAARRVATIHPTPGGAAPIFLQVMTEGNPRGMTEGNPCRVAQGSAQSAGAPADMIPAVVGGQLSDAVRQQVLDFAPEWVVCWLMGADDRALDPNLPQAQAVKAYREVVHRQVAELATGIPSVSAVHIVDRTAFPWKIKDTARQTLQLYHQATSFANLPWSIELADTLYRKLDQRQWPTPAGPSGMAGAGIVPVLGSLIARRRSDVAAP